MSLVQILLAKFFLLGPLVLAAFSRALPESWVGNRVREWKKGEHRELVEDPTE